MADLLGALAAPPDAPPAGDPEGSDSVRIAAWTPPLYFDAAAGLPPHPETVRWLTAGMATAWAAPAGRHSHAARTRAVLAQARETVAGYLGCRPGDVWFAPSTDVALCTAIAAAVDACPDPDLPVLVSPLERLSVLRFLDALAPHRLVVQLDVDAEGLIDPAAAVLAQPAAAIVIGAANREIGTAQPIDAIAAREGRTATLIVDGSAVRARHELPAEWDVLVLDPAGWGGPDGIAILASRPRAAWSPTPPATIHNRFPGRVPAALAAAAAMGLPDSPASRAEEERLRVVVDDLAARLQQRIGHVAVLGPRHRRLGYLLSLSLLYVNSEQLVDDLTARGFSVHSGSACTSDTRRPSHVLTAIGALTHGNLRISLPPGCPPSDVDALVEALAGLVHAQRREAGVG